MGKIKIETGRGTGTVEVDSESLKPDEETKNAREKAILGRTVSSGRGTGSHALNNIHEPKKPKYKGSIISGRGTGSRKSS